MFYNNSNKNKTDHILLLFIINWSREKLTCILQVPDLYILKTMSNNGGGGGYSHQNRMWCACRTSKIWLFLYHYFAQFPTHQYRAYHFRKKSTQVWPNWVLFHDNWPKNTPNLCNLGSFVSDENPLIATPNFAKKRPKCRHVYTYIMSMREPPPPINMMQMWNKNGKSTGQVWLSSLVLKLLIR